MGEKEVPELISKNHNVKIFIDGRNAFEKTEFKHIIYKGIGR